MSNRRPLPRARPIWSAIGAGALVFGALGSASCSGDAGGDDERLRSEVAELRGDVADLRTELQRQERQIASLSRSRAVAGGGHGRARAGNAAAGQPTADGPDAIGSATAPDGTVDTASGDQETSATHDPALTERAATALLETEVGRKAIQAATAAELARRQDKERRLAVSYQVGMFARNAGLDDRQTKDLQAIWKRSLDEGAALRATFAKIAQLPEAERERARDDAMETMRGLGRSRRENVADLLTPDQMEQYEKVDEEIVRGLHGAPRR